jgi:putative Holliday junction resolvase
MPEPAAAATILAFDYGLKRIGVAVGQTITGSASPLATVSNRATGVDLAEIGRLVREWRPAVLVVGLPLNADGSPSDMSRAATAFATSLECFARPVLLVDERHTSAEAGAEFKKARQAGQRGRVRRERIDAAAAVLIAERYLQGAAP